MDYGYKNVGDSYGTLRSLKKIFIHAMRLLMELPESMNMLQVPTAFRSPLTVSNTTSCSVTGNGECDNGIKYIEVNTSTGESTYYYAYTVKYFYGNYSYNISFRNTYSTNPSKNITVNLITGGFALRGIMNLIAWCILYSNVELLTTTAVWTVPTAGVPLSKYFQFFLL